MADAINAFFDERQVPAHVDTFGSIAYFSLPAELTHAGLLYYYLRERGVHIQEGFPLFLTTAHSDADIAHVMRGFQGVRTRDAGGRISACSSACADRTSRSMAPLPHLNGNGVHLPAANLTPGLGASDTSIIEKSAAPSRQVPLTESQKEIWLSAKLSEEASCCYNESFTLKMRGDLDVSALFSLSTA